MPQYELLNNIDHGSLRVVTGRGAQYGDDVMFVPTFPIEMRSVQAHYPILIHKDQNNGQLYPVVLFGFEKGENLFLEGDTWNAPYIPMMIRRQPFLVAFQKRSPGAEAERVMSIDMSSPRVSMKEGQPLFKEHGGHTDFLNGMADMLEAIHQGHEQNKQFMDTLTAHDLIESVTLDITLEDGSRYQLQGMYTLNDERLQQLEQSVLIDLASTGFLLPTYMMVASLSQLQSLIALRNARLTRPQA